MAFNKKKYFDKQKPIKGPLLPDYPNDPPPDTGIDSEGPFVNIWGGGSPVVDPDVLNDNADTVNERQATVVASGALLGRLYGRSKLGAKLGKVFESGGKLVCPCFFCEGPVDAIEEIEVDNEVHAATKYTGTQVSADPDLITDGQTDILQNVAYAVVKLDDDENVDIKATIRGTNDIWDPRLNSGTGGYAYTANPALILADYAIRYGDVTVDWPSVEIAADYCDETVGGAPRWEVGILLNEPKDFDEYLEVLRGYANCFFHWEDDVLYLIPDKPMTSVASLTLADFKGGTLDIQRISEDRIPNQVIVRYTDTTTTPWADRWAATDVPVGEVIHQTIYMPGIHSYDRAKRTAIERLNKLQLQDFALQGTLYDDFLPIKRGEVVNFTDAFRGISKPLRLVEKGDPSIGRFNSQFIEYDPNAYSNSYQTEPTYPDTNLPSPLDFPIVANLAGEEKLWTDGTGKTHTVFQITFDGGSWPFTSGFRYRVYRTTGNLLLAENPISYQGAVQHSFVTPPTTQGDEWSIRVWVLNKDGQHDPTQYAEILLTGNGKTIPPSNISQASMIGYEFGFFVSISHGEATDSDLLGYRYKRLEKSLYDAAANDAARWNHAQVVTLVNKQYSPGGFFAAQPVGQYMYGVRAVDSWGNESVASAWILVNVTEQNAGQIATYDANSTVGFENTHLYSKPGIAIGGNFATSRFPSRTLQDLFGTLSNPFPADQDKPFEYFGVGIYDTNFYLEEWDTGADRSGVWDILPRNITELVPGGQINRFVWLKPDGGSYGSAKIPPHAGFARYFFGQLSYRNPTTVQLPITYSFAGQFKEETQTVNIPASPQPHPIVFTEPFAEIPDLSYTPLGSTQVTIAFDNATNTGIDVRAWDSAGSPVAATIKITVKGV